jgi:hypothetical protein
MANLRLISSMISEVLEVMNEERPKDGSALDRTLVTAITEIDRAHTLIAPLIEAAPVQSAPEAPSILETNVEGVMTASLPEEGEQPAEPQVEEAADEEAG